MDITQALSERRTVHKYHPTPVPESDILEALEAGMLAPNHRPTFPWRSHPPGAKARATIGTIGLDLKRKKAEKMGNVWDEALCEKVKGKFTNPGALFIVTQVHHDDPMTDKEDYATIACAIQNITLSLFAKGWGTKWSTGGVTRHPDVYALLGIEDPKAEEIVGFIWIGEAATKGAKTPPRPALEDVLQRTA